jgi:hypothetical protein
MFFPPGKNDYCDGDVARCPFGNGLYCGLNGLSGDVKTLYRCSSGVVTTETVCPDTCVNEADGTNDHCG